MDPTAFLGVARRLLDAGDPGALRTSISRAYYGAHHVAADHLRRMGVSLPSDDPTLRPGEDHAFVQRCLRRCGDKGIATMGVVLSALHDDRTMADYRLGDPHAEDPEVAAECVASAERFVEGLTAVLSDDNRRLRVKAVVQGMHRQGRL